MCCIVLLIFHNVYPFPDPKCLTSNNQSLHNSICLPVQIVTYKSLIMKQNLANGADKFMTIAIRTRNPEQLHSNNLPWSPIRKAHSKLIYCTQRTNYKQFHLPLQLQLTDENVVIRNVSYLRSNHVVRWWNVSSGLFQLMVAVPRPSNQT